jgi:predicted DNA-binding protein YlxM (UPF0122 family)
MKAKSGPRDPAKLVEMRRLTNLGRSMRELEKHFGVSRQQIHKYLKRHQDVIIDSDKAIVE